MDSEFILNIMFYIQKSFPQKEREGVGGCPRIAVIMLNFSKIFKTYRHVSMFQTYFFYTLTLVCFSPYITHNYIASHVQFLKKVNEGRGRKYNLWRIFPLGGRFNSRGDVLALLTWYLMLVYAAVAIPVSGLYVARKDTLSHPYAVQWFVCR